MTDETRELLGLAAKAAGWEIVSRMADTGWNPLESADDCEEMEAELDIDIRWTMCSVYAERDRCDQAEEAFVDHPSRVMARRRASLRVAAEIGRRMK